MSSNMFMRFSWEGADSALTDAPIGRKLEGGNTNHVAQPKGGCYFSPLTSQLACLIHWENRNHFFILKISQMMTSRIKKYSHDPCLIFKFIASKHQKHRKKYNLKGRIKKILSICPAKEQLSRIPSGKSYGERAWVKVFVTSSFCLSVFDGFNAYKLISHCCLFSS